MLDHLIDAADGDATEIVALVPDGLEDWLADQSETTATWLRATGFNASPGTHCLLPGPGGEIAPLPEVAVTLPAATPSAPMVDQQAALPPPTPEPIAAGTSVSLAPPQAIESLRVIGEIANLYLLAEGSEGLVLIDQHAAHERVMFEKVLKEAQAKDGTAQGLLMPLTVDFSASDAQVLRANLEKLQELGFAIEAFGGNSFILTAVPAHFPQDNLEAVLADV